MKRRVVQIESLVIHGGGISPSSGRELARAVEATLSKLPLGDAGVQKANYPRPLNAAPQAIGTEVARSVHAAIRGRL